ncbi:hypothetical protein AB7645_42220 [Bradyrhizobium sp. 956_D2_N1_5]|jgi:hypothetical protein|uniref:hypothetical protein n=1 Tax=unclassified Bradyrhizobium TaxID=2631580 RepID=UPI003F1F855E
MTILTDNSGLRAGFQAEFKPLKLLYLALIVSRDYVQKARRPFVLSEQILLLSIHHFNFCEQHNGVP